VELRLGAPDGRFRARAPEKLNRPDRHPSHRAKKPAPSRHMLTVGVLAVYFAYWLGSL